MSINSGFLMQLMEFDKILHHEYLSHLLFPPDNYRLSLDFFAARERKKVKHFTHSPRKAKIPKRKKKTSKKRARVATPKKLREIEDNDEIVVDDGADYETPVKRVRLASPASSPLSRKSQPIAQSFPQSRSEPYKLNFLNPLQRLEESLKREQELAETNASLMKKYEQEKSARLRLTEEAQKINSELTRERMQRVTTELELVRRISELEAIIGDIQTK